MGGRTTAHLGVCQPAVLLPLPQLIHHISCRVLEIENQGERENEENFPSAPNSYMRK